MLMGGDGDDLFEAGQGGSTIAGQGGSDRFQVATGAMPRMASTIADFVPGEDVIGISGLANVDGFEDLTLTATNDGTLVSAQGSTLANLIGVQSNALSARDFVITSTI